MATIEKPLLSLLVAISAGWLSATALLLLLSITPLFLVILFFSSWMILEIVIRQSSNSQARRDFVTLTLLCSAMAAILSMVLFMFTGINFFVFFIILQPILYFVLQKTSNFRAALVPLLLSLFYLPLVLPLVYLG